MFRLLARVIVLGLFALGALLPAVALGNGSGGVTGPAFYVDGQLYRTVGTPTDFLGTGAPGHSLDNIYDFGGAQPNVADAAPGIPGYSGGRWQVHALGFNTSYSATLGAHDLDGNGVLDSAVEVASALSDPGLSGAQDLGVVKSFECPVIKAPRGE